MSHHSLISLISASFGLRRPLLAALLMGLPLAMAQENQPTRWKLANNLATEWQVKGDARLRFIGAIGRAATILNDEQRKILTGFAPPVSAAPAAAPMAAMKDM